MAKATVKVLRVTDKGLRKLVSEIFGKRQSSVKVGVFGDKGEAMEEGGNLTVAEIAAIHEFGLGNNPERSFIRSYIDANGPRLLTALAKLMTAAIKRTVKSGKPVTESTQRSILAKMGLFMVGEIQARISAGEITPPLSEQTIKRKGSSIPLINTGQLRASIAYDVELGAGVNPSGAGDE